MDLKTEKEVDVRYSKLAGETCCLSCGGAVNYAEPAAGEICLDLGSGRGTDVLRMARRAGKTGFAYGVDISQGMIDKARATAEKVGVTNAVFVKANLEALPVESETVDVVISNCTLNHAEDKAAVWKEIFRVLKEGGRFVISDIYSSRKVPERWAKDPLAVAECWAGAVTKDEYIDMVKNAGFPNPVILEESAPYPKGEIEVSSFTITAFKRGCSCSKNIN